MPIDLLKKLLEDEWTESADDVEGRVVDVPKPLILKRQEKKNHDLSTTDYITVADNGTTDKDASGINWQTEDKVDRVNVDIRTSAASPVVVDEDISGETRLGGFRAGGDGEMGLDPYEKETYGGLVGEVERICDKYRKGVGEYDRLVLTNFDDTSNDMGFGRWRSIGEIELQIDAQCIEPE